MTASARLAVDIGGTFTDLAIERGDQRWTTKVLTTPAAPEKGVLDGVAQVLAKAGMVVAPEAVLAASAKAVTDMPLLDGAQLK